jgi:hypothetical protein
MIEKRQEMQLINLTTIAYKSFAKYTMFMHNK